MARSFNGSTDKIDCGTGIALPTTGLSISLLLNMSSLTPTYSAIYNRLTAGATAYHQVLIKSTGKLAFYLQGASGGVNLDPATTTLATGTTYQVGLTYDTTAGLVAYLNGVSDGTFGALGALVTTGLSSVSTTFGTDLINAGRFLAGSMAEVAAWDVALTAAEMVSLAKRYSPLFIRPERLLHYHPLIGRSSPEIDVIGNNVGTLTGTSAADHPRIIMPRERFVRRMVVPPPPFTVSRQQNLNILLTGP